MLSEEKENLRVKFTPLFHQDAAHIAEYIEMNFGSEIADSVFSSFYGRSEWLVDNPRQGRKVAEWVRDEREFRELPSKHNRIIYEIRSELIIMHRIIQTRRDFGAIDTPNEEDYL